MIPGLSKVLCSTSADEIAIHIAFWVSVISILCQSIAAHSSYELFGCVTMIHELVNYALQRLIALSSCVMGYSRSSRWVTVTCYCCIYVVICWHGRSSIDEYGIWYAIFVKLVVPCLQKAPFSYHWSLLRSTLQLSAWRGFSFHFLMFKHCCRIVFFCEEMVTMVKLPGDTVQIVAVRLQRNGFSPLFLVAALVTYFFKKLGPVKMLTDNASTNWTLSFHVIS